MKRFLLIGLLLVGVGQMPADAQRKSRQIDDIYYNSKDAKADAENSKDDDYTQETSRRRNNTAQTYNSSGDEISNDEGNASRANRSYDVDDEDYGYSARINRFSYPTYRIGYYSPWYDPFYDPWYNPWYAPYWGPSPGVMVNIGWGWGGGNWGCGYPGGYYSPWAYGGGWGYNRWGWGGGYGAGYWNGYHNGFNDGYYSGNYGGGYGGYRRNINYGPRTSMSMPTNSGLRGGGGNSWNNTGGTNGRGGQRRPDPSMDQRPGRHRENYGNMSSPRGGLPDNGARGGSQQRSTTTERPGRFRVFGNDAQIDRPAPSHPSEPATERSTPRYERNAPTYERSAPSIERSTPRYEAPSRSSGGGDYGSGSRPGRQR